MHQRGANQLLLRGQQSRNRLVPNLVVVSGVERAKAAEPGIVDQDVESAKAVGDLRNDAFDLRAVAYIEPPTLGLSAFRLDFFNDARVARFIDIGNRDERTLF